MHSIAMFYVKLFAVPRGIFKIAQGEAVNILFFGVFFQEMAVKLWCRTFLVTNWVFHFTTGHFQFVPIGYNSWSVRRHECCHRARLAVRIQVVGNLGNENENRTIMVIMMKLVNLAK